MLVNLSVVHPCLTERLTVVASCEQQDVQSFADGNLRHKLDLSNWRIN